MTFRKFFDWVFESVRRGGLPAILVFTFHSIASLGFQAYQRYPPLDIPMHFFGGVVIAYFFHRASISASERGLFGPFHRVTHTVLVFALTCTAAVFWEFAEYIADLRFGTHAQLDLQDTLGDLLLGICGGITLLVATAFAAHCVGSGANPA